MKFFNKRKPSEVSEIVTVFNNIRFKSHRDRKKYSKMNQCTWEQGMVKIFINQK